MISRELQYSSFEGKKLLEPIANVIDGYLNGSDDKPVVRFTLTIEDTVARTADTVTNEKKMPIPARPTE